MPCSAHQDIVWEAGVGGVGQGKTVVGKWRQLYLNNNKNKETAE